MFTWSRTEVWVAIVLAALIVVGGSAHLWLAYKDSSRTIVVEAGSVHEVPTVVRAAAKEQTNGDERDDLAAESGALPDAGGEVQPPPMECSCPPARGNQGDGANVDKRMQSSSNDERININTAPPSELQRLPGIGPALAARIVAYREAWGPFHGIEDILEVSGVGPVTFERIKHLIKVE